MITIIELDGNGSYRIPYLGSTDIRDCTRVEKGRSIIYQYPQATLENIQKLTDRAKAAIDGGVAIDERDSRGNTALFIAAGHNLATGLMEFLLANGADINSRNEKGMTALMHAATNCHVSHVATLLKNGARINVQDDGGQTALHKVVQNFEHFEIGNRGMRVLNLLLRNKANIEVRDGHGLTPYEQSIYGTGDEGLKKQIFLRQEIKRIAKMYA